MASTIKQRIALDGGKELKRELEEFGAAGRKAFKDLQTAAAQTKGLSPGFFSSLKQAEVQIKSLAKSFQDAGKQIQSVGRGFSTALTLPIVGAGIGILKQAADFQTAMNSFVANTGAAGDAFDQAKAKAIELGNASVFSATESANAMTELAKVGLDYSQIMGGAAQATLDLAAANGGQLVPAAGIAGDLIQQFNLKAKQLPGVVDGITGTLIKSKLGFDDYRLAIGQTGGVASSLGVSLEDMNTALAGTAALFSGGSDAGTSFKTFLQRLVPQSKEAAGVFKELNLQFFDSKGKMKSLAAIAEELHLKLGKLSQEDLNDKGSTIFGTDALRTAIGLMKLGGAGFRQLAADIGTVGASKLAEVRVQGLTGELNKFNSAIETLSIAIGDSGLLEFVTKIVVKLTDFTTTLSKLNSETLRLGTVIGGLAASIGPTLIALGLFGRGLGFVLGGIGTLIGAVRGLGTALLFLRANPLVAAVSLIAGGIALWATRTDAATAALQRHEGLVDGVKDAYGQAGNAVKNMTQEIRDGLIIQQRSALQDLVPAFEAELKRLRDLAAAPAKDNPFSQALKDFAAGGGLEAYLAAVKKIGAANPELNAAAEAFVHLTDKATGLQTEIKPAADFLDLLTGKITDAQFQARQAGAGFQAFGADANAGLTNAGAAVDATNTKVEALGQTITVFRGGGAGGKLTKEVFNVVDGVATRAEEGKQALDGLKSSVDSTSGAVDGVSTEITHSISQIAPAAQEAASGFNSSLGNLDAGAAQAAAEAIVAPFETLPAKLSAILSGMRALLQTGFSGLAGIVNTLAAQVEAAIARILASLRAAAAAAQSLRGAAGSSSSSDSGGSHGGFAAGGYLASGPGTPTSDSIPIWASVKEFIMQAKATAYYGPGFMHALNQMKIPRDFFKAVRGFNMGGAVDGFSRSLAMPRMATGGMIPIPAGGASSSSSRGKTSINLNFPGFGSFEVMADDAVAAGLTRVAIKAGLLSTGRKPGRK
ncbi:hypothetical protein X735_12590 [Mesorhizobium sp. L2C085B000]|uniref:phage tail tape measure protein n=1 Tax=Mesorhizobium sp. L2C085B000 TaxID=1287117 RepID=UPI0003CF9EF9|nr:phage tail tape measure protein [Mesorhizobium sp. L2C085B000]ESZ17798.1 hypothetical protein X735_12590 [Mesorhizobium sp. L2C085B000]